MAVVAPRRGGQGATADAGDGEEPGPEGVSRGGLRQGSPAGTRSHRYVHGSVSGINTYPALPGDRQGATADAGDGEEPGPAGVSRGGLREGSPAGTRSHRYVQGPVSSSNGHPAPDDALVCVVALRE